MQALYFFLLVFCGLYGAFRLITVVYCAMVRRMNLTGNKPVNNKTACNIKSNTKKGK